MAEGVELRIVGHGGNWERQCSLSGIKQTGGESKRVQAEGKKVFPFSKIWRGRDLGRIHKTERNEIIETEMSRWPQTEHEKEGRAKSCVYRDLLQGSLLVGDVVLGFVS
jgi:hypothetical protein